MACGILVKWWWRVPAGAKLELSLICSDDQYTENVCFKIDGGPTDGSRCHESWPRREVAPGPKVKALGGAVDRYDVEIRIDFLGEAETAVEVKARLLEPDGSPHGTPFATTHRGKSGQSCETRLTMYLQ